MSKFDMKFTSYDDIFKSEKTRQEEALERVQELPVEQFHNFQCHPFQIRQDEEMQNLVESITTYGVLTPILARPLKEENQYEIVSGHRRVHACKLAGIEKVPVLVRDLTDDEATILMVDSNLQREHLLYSEKAWAYRMKLEAMKRQGKRTDLTCAQLGHKLGDRKKSKDILAEQTGESRNQIQRYIRLTYLNPDLLDYADKGKLAFNAAVEVSYLTPEEQCWLCDLMEQDDAAPSLKQASRMKQFSKEGKLSLEVIEAILSEEKPVEAKVTLKGDKLRKYFPKSYTPRQMEETIVKLLENWYKRQHEKEQ